MLRDIIKAIDKNGDQIIQYEGMSCDVIMRFCPMIYCTLGLWIATN
jgi:hypothetical protein